MKLKNKSPIYIVLLTVILMGCEKNTDDHIYTLYSSYKNNRLHVATFDTTPTSWDDKKTDAQFKKWIEEENFMGCKKVVQLLEKDWKDTVQTNEIKYWCEKGRYRK